MALTPGKAAGYYEWKAVADDRAVVVFKIREVPEPFEYTPPGKKTRTIHPVVVDFVVLTGSQAKTVVRDETIWGSGFRGLRRYPPVPGQELRDVVCVMGWKKGDVDFVTADVQPEDSDAYRLAAEMFARHAGDPYTAAERAANPTATLTPAPEPIPEPAPPAPPAANAPAPWGQNGAAQPVGGPQGAAWGQPAATATAEPVAAGSEW